ncbi:MAG: hypothetical protein Q7J16_03480 [Candidatus Cloacimonadales bacterium]|nr:hypothetical protein [Candidatus Cloacimonadales bacterium]
MKISAILLFLLLCSLLAAQQADFQSYMTELLEKNSNYQQALSKFEQEKALTMIDKSLGWFDVNFIYKQYDNDFIRNETKTVLEHSDVVEKDKRWRLELDKQLFPKDFDNVANAINSRLNLLRYEQELALSRYNCISDIFADMLVWYEAAGMIEILQERLEILYQQNIILEELDLENVIEPETMIMLLEEIDNREDDLYDYRETASLMNSKYGDILDEFYNKFQLYIQQNDQPDTLLFSQGIDAKIKMIKKDVQGISNKIKWNYYNVYLPEVNLKLSYNWRENRQDWDIEKSGLFETMTRNQDEEFPEGEIEFSLPFNIFSNTGGKHALLKVFERELHYRSRELQLAWQSFKLERINFYQEAKLELKRKTRLHELYVRDLNLQKTKFQAEPSLLGTNPELKLQKETIKAAEAEMKMKMAEMKLYREIFLINSFGEEAK